MRVALSTIVLLLLSLSSSPVWGAELDDLDLDTFETEIKEGLYRQNYWEKHRLVRITIKGDPSDMPERLANALIELRHQGFVVEGGYLAGPQFDREVEKLRHGGGLVASIMMLLPLPAEEPLARRDFLRSALRAWSAGPKALAQKVFGMPAGWLSPEEIRFIPKQKHVVLLLMAEGLHNWLLNAKLKGMGSQSPQTLPHIILAAYLYSYISNIDEMMRQKGSGGTIRHDASEPVDRQISVAPTFSWVTTQTCLEEFIINFALRSSIAGFGQTLGNTGDVVADSVFSGFAKSFSERMITAVYSLSADAKRRGRIDLMKKYDFWAATLIQVFYNGVFPALKMMQLPGKSETSRQWSNTALASMGALGVGLHWYQMAHQPMNAPEESCGQVLIQFLPRENEADHE